MSAPPIFRRVSSLKGLGVFRNYEATPDVPDLQRHNLVYGFNGSGKTTLSRVFASLEGGAVRPELPEGARFEIELTDGTIIKSGGALDALKERLLVFNVDFIEENLRWKEGTANPVFYLGRAQAELAKNLKEIEAELATLKPKQAEANRDHGRKERAFAERKRDAARLIAEQLGLGRRYDASDLDDDYHNGPYDETLSDEQRQQLRATINQDAPLAKRHLVDAASLGLEAFLDDVRKVLDTTLGSTVVEELQRHEGMLKWVKEGLDYHEQHELSSCLFCGNQLTETRIAVLQQAIDGRYDTLIGDIADAKAKAERLHSRLAAMKDVVPSINDISQDLQKGYSFVANNFRMMLSHVQEIVSIALVLLDRKAMAPNLPVDPGDLDAAARTEAWDTTAAQHVHELNEVIQQHNKSHDDFDKMQEFARTKLKTHFLADGQASYRQMEGEVASAKAVLDDLTQKYRTRTQEGEAIKQQMRQHGPAAEIINSMLHSYLGHKELKIGTMDIGYAICRNGRPVTGSLSEGEKTAIALCYFLSTLKAEGRQLKNLIIVVDDPISSLDTRALHYAFSVIKGMLEGAGQVIIMTHNLHFMNEVKRWLRKRAEEGKAALLFLDAVHDAGADRRSASIRKMPKLLRDYESEYQYLFHLVVQFNRQPGGQTEYFYLMPNALRKVLEIFLAFKLPGPEGLSNKVENVANGGYGLDPSRVRALDRLVQLESHADNLDDLTTFSSMTIEETRDAADALLGLMATLDRGHYDRLSRLCR